MTRWHEDDLVGRLMSENASPENANPSGIRWKLLNLPALAEEGDLLGREIGEPLWGERFSKQDLARIKESLGSYWFSSLYQQNPVPAGNSIFKRSDFRYFEEFDTYYNFIINPLNSKKVLKKDISIFVTSDLALSLKETADFTVLLVFAKLKSGEILVLDIIRERFESTEHLKLFSSINAKYKPVLIGIENVQFQQSLIQQAVKTGLPIKPLKADKDKISRALPIATLMENGKVFFRKNAAYLEEFEKELLQFPKSKHDDQVDAFGYINQIIQTTSGLLPV
jgi:predicted phage terminase large subunit-like protein